MPSLPCLCIMHTCFLTSAGSPQFSPACRAMFPLPPPPPAYRFALTSPLRFMVRHDSPSIPASLWRVAHWPVCACITWDITPPSPDGGYHAHGVTFRYVCSPRSRCPLCHHYTTTWRDIARCGKAFPFPVPNIATLALHGGRTTPLYRDAPSPCSSWRTSTPFTLPDNVLLRLRFVAALRLFCAGARCRGRFMSLLLLLPHWWTFIPLLFGWATFFYSTYYRLLPLLYLMGVSSVLTAASHIYTTYYYGWLVVAPTCR